MEDPRDGATMGGGRWYVALACCDIVVVKSRMAAIHSDTTYVIPIEADVCHAHLIVCVQYRLISELSMRLGHL